MTRAVLHNNDIDTTEVLRSILSFFAVNLPWVFLTIWLVYGLVPVLLIALAVYHLINRLELRQIRDHRNLGRH